MLERKSSHAMVCYRQRQSDTWLHRALWPLWYWVLKLLPHFKPYLCKELAGVDIGQLILKKLFKHTDYIFPCREIP